MGDRSEGAVRLGVTVSLAMPAHAGVARGLLHLDVLRAVGAQGAQLATAADRTSGRTSG